MREYIKELISDIEKLKNPHDINITPDYIFNEYLGYVEKNNLEKSGEEYEKFAVIFLQEGVFVNLLS